MSDRPFSTGSDRYPSSNHLQALIFQADANVRVHLTDKGEHVLVTAGEVHLERCLRDLRETYAEVEVVASTPGNLELHHFCHQKFHGRCELGELLCFGFYL